MTYIHHVTLNTGHTRRSLAGEVSAEALAACKASLAICLSGTQQRAPLGADLAPDIAAYQLTATAQGRCLVATIWHGHDPVCTVAIARHGRCGSHLWRLMHEPAPGVAPLVTDGAMQPQAPWCAVRLEAGITRHLDAAQWLGDYERCLAWAWIEIDQEDK